MVGWWDSSPALAWMVVAHVLAAAEVASQCPPVLQMCDAVFDPDTA